MFPVIACPKCDLGLVVGEGERGSVRLSHKAVELFCLKCDYVWRTEEIG